MNCQMNSSCHNIPKKYSHLSLTERVQIQTFLELGWPLSAIARRLSRSKSVISAEQKLGTYKGAYSATIAQKRADKRKTIPRKPSKSNNNELLHKIERLLRRKRSPESISNELDGAVSHTTIYTLIRTIRPEWHKYLIWQGKGKYHKGSAGKSLIPDRVDISQRPAEIMFGDWGADTVIPVRRWETGRN